MERETEKFLDHHRAKGSVFKDWEAAWRNWMRRAIEWSPARTTQGLRSVTDEAVTMVFGEW